MMKHLTLTGYYAGQPYCGCNREDNPDDTFCHLPYVGDDSPFWDDVCPKCKAIYFDDSSEEE